MFYIFSTCLEVVSRKKKKEKRKLIRSSGTDNNCVSFPLSSLYRVDFYINTPRRGYERASHRARLVSIRLALGTRCEVTRRLFFTNRQSTHQRGECALPLRRSCAAQGPRLDSLPPSCIYESCTPYLAPTPTSRLTHTHTHVCILSLRRSPLSDL